MAMEKSAEKSNDKIKVKTTQALVHATNNSGNTEDKSSLIAEMEWLQQLIDYRCEALYHDDFPMPESLTQLPELDPNSAYGKIVLEHELDRLSRVVFALAVATEFDQSVFKRAVYTLERGAADNTDIGGEFDAAKKMFKPTFQTALFVIAGKDRLQRANCAAQLYEGNALLKAQIVYNTKPEHFMQGVIELDNAYLRYILTGTPPQLDHGKYFPAQLLKNGQKIDDVITAEAIKTSLFPIGKYIYSMNNNFYTQGNHKFKKGFMALFYGPPGTGKTMLAGALANEYGIDMYRVDLSQVVSKYIGETEKNLEVLFDRLQGKNCMLFFDEADALFGKRAEVQDAQDRFANQEVSYLLQRIEQFDGLTILATNFENNLDDAFKRRINVMIHMIRPKEEERKQLWQFYLPEGHHFKDEQLLDYLTREFGYTGANIKNVMEMLALDMFEKQTQEVTLDLIKPYLTIENIKAFGMNKARVPDMRVRPPMQPRR